MGRCWLTLLVYGFSLGCGAASSPSEWRATRGDLSVEVRTDPFQVSIYNRLGDEVLSLFDGDGAYGSVAATVDDPEFEVHVVPGWDGYTANEGEYSKATSARFEETSDDRARVRFGRGLEASMSIALLEGRVRFEVQTEALVPHIPWAQHTKASVAFRLRDDEHFFGLGQRTATVDHRGWSLYNWSEEGGLGAGEGARPGPKNPFPNGPSMTNFPVPVVHSSAGYLLFVDTPYRSEFHLGSERPDAWRVAVNRNAFAFTVYPDPEPLTNLDRYTEDTGRPLLPAPWVFGPRRRVSLEDRVMGEPEWQLLRRRNVPTTSLDDNVHFLPDLSHVGRQDELRAWVETLHANGFKVMAYNNPYVSMEDERAADDLAYGIDNELFLMGPDRRVATTYLISGKLQNIATIDLTRDEGVRWFQALLKRTLDMGYDGWMHDFGEYVARDWFAGDGRFGDALHNVFPVLSAKAAYELMQRERPGDFHFHVRSGYAGTQQYVPAVWNGDPEATFDPTQGLPASLFGGINLSMSGVPFWGSDISGFKCYTDDPHDKEMYLRWAQLGAVSPIMQNQSACANVTGRRPKWTLWSDEETTRVYGALARLHTRLQPYFLVLARQAHETGAPLMRHPFLLFPREPAAWRVTAAFFLGDALYAAPVVRRGDRSKTVWLPPGEYLDWNEARAYAGGREVTVPAPLDRLPLFLVANALLPMLDPSIETLAEATEPDVVTPSKVSDRLDVVAFMTGGAEAERTLEDGTVLRVEMRDAEARTGSDLRGVTADALDACARCFLQERMSEKGGREVVRLRVNTAEATSDAVEIGRFRLRHQAGRDLRVRWDLYFETSP